MVTFIVAVFCFMNTNAFVGMSNLFVGIVAVKAVKKLDRVGKVKTIVRAVTAVRFCRTAWRFYVTRKPHKTGHSIEHEASALEAKIREVLERDLPGVVREQVAGYHREKITTTTG